MLLEASYFRPRPEKKECQALILALSTKIRTLEAQHKRALALNTSQELAERRTLSLEKLFKRARRRNVLSQKLFFEQGNKPGRLLARATQQRKLASTVHRIVDSMGRIHTKNEDIAQQFHCFYSKLYNLRPGDTNPVAFSKRQELEVQQSTQPCSSVI